MWKTYHFEDLVTDLDFGKNEPEFKFISYRSKHSAFFFRCYYRQTFRIDGYIRFREGLDIFRHQKFFLKDLDGIKITGIFKELGVKISRKFNWID